MSLLDFDDFQSRRLQCRLASWLRPQRRGPGPLRGPSPLTDPGPKIRALHFTYAPQGPSSTDRFERRRVGLDPEITLRRQRAMDNGRGGHFFGAIC
ncbi:hypothetical protein CABS01_10714 [Colletotrichum abscissum]|uniref:Uncharacterized protein n=1 Tax=Colletotrichum abscissum TaxID=1671311 RepID=A0A9P9XNX8_9PEZI|nr:uncharacterized protein CABS01_10714 [Colletotrichum abscissum]KAI3557423.1 hypothetical protein CABS02_02527 [Colletotrichum abscissum]KAK1497736.1 hypothetical protein CABS01_10714 [Colletotrichum abscissum]